MIYSKFGCKEKLFRVDKVVLPKLKTFSHLGNSIMADYSKIIGRWSDIGIYDNVSGFPPLYENIK
jgi:hypothetical protein